MKKICKFRKKRYLCNPIPKGWSILFFCCGNSSVGRAQPCQGWGREFESRFPLKEGDTFNDASPLFFCTTSPDSNSLLCQSDCRRLRAVKSPQDCFTNRLRGLSGECLTGGLRRWQKLAQRKNRFIPKTTRRRECPLGGLSDRIFCFVPIILVSSGTITCPRNYPNSLLRAG